MSNRYEVEVELGETKVTVQAVADSADEAKTKVAGDFSGDAVVGKAKKLSGGEESDDSDVKTYTEEEVEAQVKARLDAELAAAEKRKQAEINAEVERQVAEALAKRTEGETPAADTKDGTDGSNAPKGRQARGN